MALVGRAIVWWFLGSFFLLLVALRLDNSMNWNWFVVFTPIWLLDIFSIIYLIALVIVGVRNNRLVQRINELRVSKERAGWLLAVHVLKLTFGMLLCAQLDGYLKISYFFLFIPLWLMLVMLGGIAMRDTWQEANHAHRQ